MIIKQTAGRKTRQQIEADSRIARLVRDAGAKESASALAKYYSAADLRTALAALRQGEEVTFA